MNPQPATSLQAAGLQMLRGKREVLRGIDCTAAGGEFIAVIGPNGSGKSTLLAALAGLLKPTAGSIRLDGSPLSAIAPRDLAHRRAYLPQNARCEWPLSVARMVALGLVRSGGAPRLAADADLARIESVLADCDLLTMRDQPVTTLSGGELARAMLARALVSDPAVIIVDEPLAGLDPRHAWDAAQRLRTLAVEQGRLVIASIHDLNIALRRATRVWALHQGTLRADGPPADAINSRVLGELFGIAACVSGSGNTAYVDFAC